MRDLKRRFWKSMLWLTLGEAFVIGYLVAIYNMALPWYWSLAFFGSFMGLAGLKKLVERDSLAAPIALGLASIFPFAQTAVTYFGGVGTHDPMASLETCKGLVLGAIMAPVILLVWYSLLKLEYEKTRSAYDVD